MTSTARRKRDTLSPRPILDHLSIREALEKRGSVVKDSHIDTFYGLLHRQQYPTLSEFVENYHRDYEEREVENQSLNHQMNRKRTSKRLPKVFLDFLADSSNNLATLTSKVHSQFTSLDGTTTKLVIKLQDEHLVESVLMRYGNRVTLCVSSQVGCKMGCNFCATGTMGLRGNLSDGEILEQLVHADRILRQEIYSSENDYELINTRCQLPTESVRNIVFMGMGEPLDNYDNVIAACRAMVDSRRWKLAHGHVTVSTVGITHKMRQLTRDLPEINLALSLHAPNEVLRQKIVPTSKVYSIQDMIDALDKHMMARKQESPGTTQDKMNPNGRKKAMIEYVMLMGETSSLECAHQLGKLCENRHLVVNLIPYNQTDVRDKLTCPPIDHIREFQRIVVSYGVFCTIRTTMGADISGACGQLVKKHENHDIEDLQSTREKTVNPTKKTRKEKLSEYMLSKKEKQHLAYNGDEKWVRPLMMTTLISASCCVVSSLALFWIKKRR